MWFLIKILISAYVGLAGILAFVNIFFINGYLVVFMAGLPFYGTAWAYLIITIRNEYKRDKKLKEEEEEKL